MKEHGEGNGGGSEGGGDNGGEGGRVDGGEGEDVNNLANLSGKGLPEGKVGLGFSTLCRLVNCAWLECGPLAGTPAVKASSHLISSRLVSPPSFPLGESWDSKREVNTTLVCTLWSSGSSDL